MLFVLYCFNVQLYVPHIILITIFLFRKKYRGVLQTGQSEGYTWPILKVTALADVNSDLCEMLGRTGSQWPDSPAWQMLMSKHALLVLRPCEHSPRSANKAAEIKEPKRVDGVKDMLQASSKEPNLESCTC